jgi:hypothetical protein
MLGKVVAVAAAGAAALLLRSRPGQEAYARLVTRSRALPVPGRRPGGTVPKLVDRRPQSALDDGAGSAPALLPDATAGEVAVAVSTEQVRPT